MFVVFPLRKGHCASKDNSTKMKAEVGGTHAPPPLRNRVALGQQ